MKVLVFISLIGSLLLASCGGSGSKSSANTQEVNPADTIYLGDYARSLRATVYSLRLLLPI